MHSCINFCGQIGLNKEFMIPIVIPANLLHIMMKNAGKKKKIFMMENAREKEENICPNNTKNYFILRS